MKIRAIFLLVIGTLLMGCSDSSTSLQSAISALKSGIEALKRSKSAVSEEDKSKHLRTANEHFSKAS